METKYSLRRFGFFIIVGAILFTTLFSLWINNKQIISEQRLNSKEQIFIGLPVRLKIAAINIDANIEHVGITEGGAMDAPKGPLEVAWYNLGPRPGEVGSAVIDGHSGWKDSRPAVFDNLHKLKKGDKIFVESDTGEITIFVVRELRSYGLSEDTSSVFEEQDGLAHLNLITCSGDWNPLEQTHSSRLVVFTDQEI